MSLFLQHLRLPFGPEVLEGHEGEVPAQAQAGEAVADVVQAQVLAEEIAVAVAAAVPEGASDKRILERSRQVLTIGMKSGYKMCLELHSFTKSPLSINRLTGKRGFSCRNGRRGDRN